MIVVVVLTMSCQVSLNPNNGPVDAQITINNAAIRNVNGLPAYCEVRPAISENTRVQVLPSLSLGLFLRGGRLGLPATPPAGAIDCFAGRELPPLVCARAE